MVIGPTAPTKGGIAQHTEALTRHLADVGHDMTVRSWSAQYPDRLYPGTQEVPGAQDSTITQYATVRRSLRWFDPFSWVEAGWRARHQQLVVIALVVPFQVVAFATIIIVSRFARSSPRIVVVAHNVLPHESRRPDRLLVRGFCRLVDRMIVHTESQASLADQLGARTTIVVPIPPHLDTTGRRDRVGEPRYGRIAFLGIVREYKGVDVLLRALESVPDLELRVHGECWVASDELERKIDQAGLRDRVIIDDRFVPDDEISDLFDDVDALVLPYRSGTASQLVLIAHQLGVPVIATSVGSFPDQITPDVDGLLCEPDDPAALASALQRLSKPGVLDRLRAGAFHAPGADHLWDPYIEAVVGT